MFIKEISIPELYLARHKYDSKKISFDYENKLLDKSISPVMFKNDNTSGFLNLFQKLLVFNINSILELRNAFNHTVNKYYGDHSN